MMTYKSTIAQWQEAVLELPESNFFELMRLYIGEIKTPYNKQKLIEQLASFIHNAENQKHIIDLLDAFDINILTAIYYTENPTKDTLCDFFTGEYGYSEVLFQLSNLTSRLVLFKQTDKYSSKQYYRINPLLLDKLLPVISLSNILVSNPVALVSYDDSFFISPNFLAAFISYLNTTGISCKNDGIIKKTDMTKIEQVFPGKTKCIQLLVNAFVNLSLVKEGERKIELDFERIKMFAELSQEVQIAFLCAASCSRFSRDGLKKQSQLLIDCISSIPESGYTIPTITKLAFLTAANSEKIESASRFSAMLSEGSRENYIVQQAGNIIDLMLESAIEFGVLQEIGKDEKGLVVYKKGNAFNPQPEMEKVLNIDSTYTATIMPGLTLRKLIPLTVFLQITHFSIVSEYAISKQSICAGFDRGQTPDSIFQVLENLSAYEIPQNLRISIAEWYNNYVSAMIYHGYILRVSGNNIQIAENNPRIKSHIKEKLAEGIYLLDIPPTAEIKDFINESGFDFMGRVRNTIGQNEKIPFPLLRKGKPLVFEQKEAAFINFNQAAEIIKSLKSELAAMDVDKNVRESLLNRINQRMIISPEQLKKAFVRSEILEVSGTDYTGKFHIIKDAMGEQNTMEITIPDSEHSGQYITLIGEPVYIQPQESDAIVMFNILPKRDSQSFLLSKITRLRRLRF